MTSKTIKELEDRVDNIEILAMIGLGVAVAIVFTFFLWAWFNPYHPQLIEKSPCELCELLPDEMHPNGCGWVEERLLVECWEGNIEKDDYGWHATYEIGYNQIEEQRKGCPNFKIIKHLEKSCPYSGPPIMVVKR